MINGRFEAAGIGSGKGFVAARMCGNGGADLGSSRARASTGVLSL